jgi:hypothetical protein
MLQLQQGTNKEHDIAAGIDWGTLPGFSSFFVVDFTIKLWRSQLDIRAPDPLITERNSSLDGNAALRKPANTGCGTPDGRSDLAEIFHPLGVGLRCYHAYA